MKQKFNNLDEIYAFHNINREEFEQSISNLSQDTQAYEILKLIVSAYNNNEKPDFSDWNQSKYEPWFDMENSSAGGFACIDYDHWLTYTGIGSRLCYSSRELAEYAGKQFKDIYEEYFVIK